MQDGGGQDLQGEISGRWAARGERVHDGGDDCEEEDGLRDGAVLKREEGEDLLAVDEGARFGSKGDVLGDDLGARRPVCVDKDEVLRRATSIGRHDSG